MKIIKILTLIVVLAFLYACGSSTDTIYVNGSSRTPYSGPTPPAGDPGTSTFIANGGHCTTNDECGGGNGGSIGGYGGGVGDIWFTTSGSVEISVTVPTVTPAYGSNQLTISTDTVVLLDPAVPAAGDVYLKSSDSNVYYYDTSEHIASGLKVQPGKTLTLPANFYGTQTQISLTNAIVINGTVKPLLDGVSLDIRSTDGTAGLIQIGTVGVVTTKSATASTNGAGIYLYSAGVTINAGTIDASGSDGTTENGGNAAYSIYFKGATGGYNTGYILGKGGSSTAGAGGSGSYVYLYAYTGTLFNSGIIDNSGGTGATTGGARGYDLQLIAGYNDMTYIETSGSVFASGSLTSNSGNSGTGVGGGGSGYGGNIYLESYGGKTWSNATISSKGGNSIASSGGGGGGLNIEAYDSNGSGGYGGAFVASEGIQLGGNIDLSGGNGATGGGSGGNASFQVGSGAEIALSYMMTGPSIWLKGFKNISLNGGAGTTAGGSGGGMMVASIPLWMIDVVGYAGRAPCGAIFNQVPISVRGGDADTTTGTGGQGGSMIFTHLMAMSFPPSTTISNSGDLDVSGGVGNIGGNSGFLAVASIGELTNSGTITARGGAGTTTGGNGATPTQISQTSTFPVGVYLWAAGDITNSGVINASGGTATTTGGNGGEIALEAGGKIRNSASIAVAGGAATTTGGNGGRIFLTSETPPTSNSGTLSVTGGTGATPGTNGSTSID